MLRPRPETPERHVHAQLGRLRDRVADGVPPSSPTRRPSARRWGTYGPTRVVTQPGIIGSAAKPRPAVKSQIALDHPRDPRRSMTQRPKAALWPWDPHQLAPHQAFVEDMVSLNEPHRPACRRHLETGGAEGRRYLRENRCVGFPGSDWCSGLPTG